jgi:hypothetical protein
MEVFVSEKIKVSKFSLIIIWNVNKIEDLTRNAVDINILTFLEVVS